MITGMDNGNVIDINFTNKAYHAFLNELKKYDKPIQDLMNDFIKVTNKDVDIISVFYGITDNNKLSLLLYGQILISIMRNMDKHHESLIVLPYCILYNNPQRGSTISQIADGYIDKFCERTCNEEDPFYENLSYMP